MPHESVEALRRRLRRQLSPSSRSRFVDALLVIQAPDGSEIMRAGGAWDGTAHDWALDAHDVRPRIVRLEPSQIDAAHAVARWLDGVRRGERNRRRAIIGMGGRGSGKTYLFGGIVCSIVQLAFPGDYQFVISVQGKAKREVQEAIAEVCADHWITGGNESPQDPATEFLTGSTILWHTGNRPKSFRFAGLPIRHVLVNEAQSQHVTSFTNAISATRNLGALCTLATNAPQDGAGDWVARLAKKIAAEEVNAESFILDPKLNHAVDQDALDDIGELIRAVDEGAYRADVLGQMELSGPVAYPKFKPTALQKGGHLIPVEQYPPVVGWVDVTREVTREWSPATNGFEYIAGADFQVHPGCCATPGKIFRRPDGRLVRFVREFIVTSGRESDLTIALQAAGYWPGPVDAHGKPAASCMLVGDATGANQQDAAHRKGQPYSFAVLGADGWKIVAPDRHRKTGSPWWAPRVESRKQMAALFIASQVVLGPMCRESRDPFPSLADSFVNCKVHEGGAFMKKGGFSHGPDCERYVCWRFLDRPKPPTSKPLDEKTFNDIAGIRLLST
jgi:hypothetical protein